MIERIELKFESLCLNFKYKFVFCHWGHFEIMKQSQNTCHKKARQCSPSMIRIYLNGCMSLLNICTQTCSHLSQLLYIPVSEILYLLTFLHAVPSCSENDILWAEVLVLTFICDGHLHFINHSGTRHWFESVELLHVIYSTISKLEEIS